MWYKTIKKKRALVLVAVFVLITTKAFYLSQNLPSGTEMQKLQQNDGMYSLENTQAAEASEKERRNETLYNLKDHPKARMTTLAKMCGKQPHSWSSLTFKQKQTVSRHVIVNDKFEFLFCYVPKVACSNWKRVMMALDGRVTDPNNVNKYNHRGFTFLEDFPNRGIQRKIDSYFKFMFVRDPLDRLVSAYRNKFVRQNSTYFIEHYGKLIAKKYRKKLQKDYKGNDITLNEFFRHLSETEVEKMNEHWTPFNQLCQPCAMQYDFVGSFEDLVGDANTVLRHLNSTVRFPRQQSYYKFFDKKERNTLLETVPYDVLKKVLEKYSLDYKLFSYQFPDDRLRESRIKSKQAKKKRHDKYAY